MTEGRSGKRSRVARWSIALAVVLALGLAIKYGRHHVLPRRFVEVVPGQLYRSGYLEQRPLRAVIDEHGIKTVLALLNDEPDNPEQRREEAILAEKGVRLVRMGMPGDGIAELDKLDRAADVLADGSNHPLLVHCAAGVNRTGAVYAAWRMKHCGWTTEQAMEEAERCGWSPRDNPQMRTHLEEYWRAKVKKPGSGE